MWMINYYNDVDGTSVILYWFNFENEKWFSILTDFESKVQIELFFLNSWSIQIW